MLCWIYSIYFVRLFAVFWLTSFSGKCPSQSTDGSKTHRFAPGVRRNELDSVTPWRCFSKDGGFFQ